MFTYDEAVKGFTGFAVYICIIRICYQLYKGVPILLTFRDEVSKDRGGRLDEALSSAIDWSMVHSSGVVLDTKQDA